jgi:hypothetical protein
MTYRQSLVNKSSGGGTVAAAISINHNGSVSGGDSLLLLNSSIPKTNTYAKSKTRSSQIDGFNHNSQEFP